MKFLTEYKNKIKKIFLVEGIQKAIEVVWQEFPKTTKGTIKTWVNDEHNKCVQEARRKSYLKVKTEKPEVYVKRQQTSYENNKHRRKTDPELRKRRVEYSANWAKNNRDRVNELDRKYWKQGGKERSLARRKKRNKSDLEYRLRCNTRARAHGLFKKAFNVDSLKKPESTIELFGCTLPFLIEYLRKLYKPGMTDENYGEWELDHIKPCVLFNFTDKQQRLDCFHYSNLQPLWWKENNTKSDNYK